MQIKLRLSVVLPSNVSVISTEPEFIKTIDNKKILHYPRKFKTAKQVINISDSAYDEFIHGVPEWCSKRDWNRYSNQERIRQHCVRIMESLGGISFEYDVLDD